MDLTKLKHGDTIVFQKSLLEKRTFPIEVVNGVTTYVFSLNSRIYHFDINKLEPYKHLIHELH